MNANVLTCPKCGGQVELDSTPQVGMTNYVCKYCRTKITITDDVTRTEHTRREIDEARILEAENEKIRLQIEQERLKKEEAKEEFNSFKKGKLFKADIIMLLLCMMFTAVAFSDGYPRLTKAVLIAQDIAFALSWLTGMRVIKFSNPNMHIIFAVIGFVLMFPFLAML